MHTYTVTKDGRTLATFTTDFEAWAYLHRIQNQSVFFAVKYEGYDIIYPDGSTLLGVGGDN